MLPSDQQRRLAPPFGVTVILTSVPSRPRLAVSGPKRRRGHRDNRSAAAHRASRDQDEEDADGGSSSVLNSALCARARRVRFVDDDDPPASFERAVVRAVDDVAKLLDLDRPGLARFNHDDVGMNAARDTAARGALAAGVALESASEDCG